MEIKEKIFLLIFHFEYENTVLYRGDVMISLEKIEGKRVAVHIPNEKSRRIFFAAMKKHYPNKIGADGEYFFDMYNIDTGFCYFPRFGENKMMTYGKRETYDDWGVPVIEFEDLLHTIDLETNASHMPIESLFG